MTPKVMPESLYHFCALNSNDRKSWLEEVLIGNKVYFRSREQLNDPNELRPSIVFEGSDKQMRSFVRQLFRNYSPEHLSPARRLREESRLIHIYRNAPESVEATLHETLDKIGIFSLSESPKHPLLWSHYAGGHRGVCIEFDASMGLFQSARLVAYTDQAPVINRLQESTSEIIDKSMLTKGDVWAYEEEWRVIARWRDENRIHRYLEQHNIQGDSRVFIEDQHGPGHYSFPPDAIRCIILGSSIGAEDESWLHTIIDRSSREIPIKQASMARNGIVTIDGL